jgi:pimeloyl-ACP methyl ester carboxylesterase
VEVPGTGHFVMLEKPQEFNKLLADFLPKATF